MSFSPKASYVQGNPLKRDYLNPTTNQVNAGDVVVVNNSLGFASTDIPGSATGELDFGNGVYDVTFGTNAVAISDGNLVRWDGTAKNAAGGTIAANLKIGPAIGATTTNSATVRVLHVPGLNI